MKMFTKITAVLCAVMVSGTVMAAAPAGTAAQQTMTVSAAATANAPKLNKTQLSLGKGESYKLTADQSVKWRTSAPKILTVDQSGNVKAVGIGTAWITAKNSAGKETSCKITVKNAPGSVSVSQKTLTLGAGEEYSISAILPEGSASASRTFRTSNSSIVKMTKTNWTGSFKAVKPGTAWVTVRLYNGKEASCKITVKKAPGWVGLTKKELVMSVGQSMTLNANIASDAGCAHRTFRTSNSSIVKMTKTNWSGSFKAVITGTAWVTVRTYNGKEASCKITVAKSWRTLYKEKLRSIYSARNNDLAFELYDVDKDGVPELFISQSYQSHAPCDLYYVNNGKLIAPDIRCAGGSMGVGGDRMIFTSGSRAGFAETVYQKTGGTIKKLYYFDTQFFKTGDASYFNVNGKKVSHSEYDRLRNKYYENVNKKYVGRAYTLNQVNYERIIDNY